MRQVKVAFVAPGQGIEDFSDGIYLLEKNSRIVEPIYHEVEESTGINIRGVCEAVKPPSDISITQPAALGIGVAQAEILKDNGVKPDYLIGFSSGEFAVAAISGAMSVADAARLAKKRGELQHRFGGGRGSAITAIHRHPLDLDKILSGLEGVWRSGIHSPNLTGFSFRHESYEALKERLMEQKAKIKHVAVPFAPHSPDVIEAQEALEEYMDDGDMIQDARTAIISIRMAKAMRKARVIRYNLIWQTTEPTRLNDAVNYALKNGVEDFYDVGPGNSMTKMLANIVTSGHVRVHPLRG